ncbi:hypothetical protein A3Q56_08645, partial [Intoshia linei]
MENKQNEMFNQILDDIDKNNDKEYIFIDPPDAHDLTDEDSADSEDETKNLPLVLSGNQLRTPAEKRHIVNDSDDENVWLSYFSKVSHCFDWNLSTKNMYCPAFPESNYTKYRGYSFTKFFKLFFDGEVVNHIIKESNIYFSQQNLLNIPINVREFKTFIGILIISGYNNSPSRSSYWSSSDDLKNFAIFNAMQRNRFNEIIRTVHFKDK